jgi:hypothetical protein
MTSTRRMSRVRRRDVSAAAAVRVAIGHTVTGSVFNGGTTLCVSTVASALSPNASP